MIALLIVDVLLSLILVMFVRDDAWMRERERRRGRFTEVAWYRGRENASKLAILDAAPRVPAPTRSLRRSAPIRVVPHRVLEDMAREEYRRLQSPSCVLQLPELTGPSDAAFDVTFFDSDPVD